MVCAVHHQRRAVEAAPGMIGGRPHPAADKRPDRLPGREQPRQSDRPMNRYQARGGWQSAVRYRIAVLRNLGSFTTFCVLSKINELRFVKVVCEIGERI
jgi:hypothetical protein